MVSALTIPLVPTPFPQMEMAYRIPALSPLRRIDPVGTKCVLMSTKMVSTTVHRTTISRARQIEAAPKLSGMVLDRTGCPYLRAHTQCSCDCCGYPFTYPGPTYRTIEGLTIGIKRGDTPSNRSRCIGTTYRFAMETLLVNRSTFTRAYGSPLELESGVHGCNALH